MFFNKISSFCTERTGKYGAPYIAFGIFGIINYPLAYILHSTYGIVGKAESMELRILATLLCIGLLLKDKWPNNLKKFLPLYWYITLTISLPMLGAYLLFQNHLALWWLMNYAIGILILILIVDWVMFLMIFPSGAILGCLLYRLVHGPLQWEATREDSLVAIYIYSLTFFLGAIFSRNKEIFAANILRTKDDLNKELEVKVEQRTEELKKALDANNYFVRNVNHEIRVPVQVITGISSGLIDNWKEFSDSHKLKLLKQLDTSGKRLFSLVTDVLDLSKFKADKMLFNIKPHDLAQTIKQVITELIPLTTEKNLKIKFGQDTLITKTEFDHERIMQVARNILSNAIKYAPKTTEISIMLSEKELLDTNREKTRNMCVTVINDGQGIPERELLTIFDPFMQSSIDHKKGKGTGLGLSIAAEIIHSHNGRIWAENTENGVRFCFAIPISISKELEDNYYTEPQETFKDTASLPLRNNDGKIHVLCVDDEEGCCIVISMILDKAKYAVTTVNNGYEALKYLEENAEKVDLILLDMLLPGMSGLEVLVELKANNRYQNIPVFIQSGMDYDVELNKALSFGAVGHISKPYIKEKILNQISEIFTAANA